MNWVRATSSPMVIFFPNRRRAPGGLLAPGPEDLPKKGRKTWNRISSSAVVSDQRHIPAMNRAVTCAQDRFLGEVSMNDTMKANGAEMARLASRVAGRAKDAFPEVDFEAAANAVAGTEFAEVLRAVSAALKRAGGGASARIESISNFVQNSSGSLTTQDAINGRQVTRAGEVRL
ncbi:Uncharacterised protein [Mycobacteroides abscessus subsp. abscessus]|nr:Uncharacterised protein [Mycobacteroides abscessus subsp. abscessus]SKU31053.1 Uncharacterised protein [Mycobacteroides abscessus subsp. abscessus]